MEDDFLKVAKEAALEAGKIIQKYSGKTSQKSIKNEDASDFATEADIEAERVIVSILSTNFPKHDIIAEENEKTNRNSGCTWVIDPLDGTFSFAVGIPSYSVSIGLIRDKKPVVGVIYQPALDNLFFAKEENGAYLNGKKIKVSMRDSLDKAAVVLDHGHRKKREGKIKRYILPLVNKVAYPFEIGSAAASLALVGQGILDGVVNQAWLWDFVAGAVIVREAGGKVTDFEGEEPDWTKERLNMVASNGLIHDQILEALKV